MNSGIGASVDSSIRSLISFVSAAAFALSIAGAPARAQSAPKGYERAFSQSKVSVEKAVKQLQSAAHGKLPTLDGFVVEGDHPLSQFERPHYDAAVEVTSLAPTECIVRVTAKVTAWYADPTAAHSGYELLTSNGRLEADFLDQLNDLLAGENKTNSPTPKTPDSSVQSSAQHSFEQTLQQSSPQPNTRPLANVTGNDGTPSAPMPQALRAPSGTVMSTSNLAATRHSETKPQSAKEAELEAEAESLEDVLKNQAHPKNLVAVKKSGTPIVDSPSLTGKTLFLASAHDEFELLDFNQDWVHVRISGISRGWVWRTNLEMPEGISDVPSNGNVPKVASDLFQISREETAQFPGDWEPLRGKNVKIISIQKIQEDEKNSGAQAKLEYAKYLLDKSYSEVSSKANELAGVVLMFDSADGGMMALTLPAIQEWKAGKLTDAALWHHCYFDPPETFTISSVSNGH